MSRHILYIFDHFLKLYAIFLSLTLDIDSKFIAWVVNKFFQILHIKFDLLLACNLITNEQSKIAYEKVEKYIFGLVKYQHDDKSNTIRIEQLAANNNKWSFY